MSNMPDVKRFKRGDRLYVQAQQIWVILVAIVMSARLNPRTSATITYGELAKLMGYPTKRAGHLLGRQLGIIGHFCAANNLPAMNVMVVDQQYGTPGISVFVRKGWTVAREQAAVKREDWFKIRVPTTGTFRQVWEST
jgi:hypothetical protein